MYHSPVCFHQLPFPLYQFQPTHYYRLPPNTISFLLYYLLHMSQGFVHNQQKNLFWHPLYNPKGCSTDSSLNSSSFLLMRRFLFVSFSQDLSGCTWIKHADSYLSPRGYSCICPDTNDRTFYVFYYNEMCR